MAVKYVEPSLGASSFTCPHCGALAHQTWFYSGAYELESPPQLLSPARVAELRKDPDFADMIPYAARLSRREVFLEDEGKGVWCRAANNLFLSKCFSCDELAIWKADGILFPPQRFEMEPNADLDADIRDDFVEAATILDKSPRGAAALLRLSIQKLLKQIGEPGENINSDIASLVRKGLDSKIQKALDLVRVIGNNAVHPGAIDVNDNREIAVRLFELVNRIAYDRITHPKEVDALYNEHLTPEQRTAIAKRDGG